MFTGIIETSGKLENKVHDKKNIHFTFSSSISRELKIDQSLAHDGVCLTVVDINGDRYKVTAIEETLQKTNLGNLSPGDEVNLERCMPANGRFDGHIVQGHVDTTARCTDVKNLDGSWEFSFSYKPEKNFITVPKGSITINGVSLTVVKSSPSEFSVCIIPYTYEHTNFKNLSATNPFVLIYHNITKQAANSYKQYRQSIAGGSYQVIDANIDELYEQFAYGINKHPVAIKNFVKYLIDSLPAKPKYVFLRCK